MAVRGILGEAEGSSPGLNTWNMAVIGGEYRRRLGNGDMMSGMMPDDDEEQVGDDDGRLERRRR